MAKAEVQRKGGFSAGASDCILGKHASLLGKSDRKIRQRCPSKTSQPSANTTSTPSEGSNPPRLAPEGPAAPPGPTVPDPRSNKLSLICPECSSARLYRAGFRYLANKTAIQRWQCCSCGYRFSENTPKGYVKPVQENSDWHLKTPDTLSSNRQVCVALARGAKNLVAVETQQEIAPREGTLSPQKIETYVWYMRKQGRAEETIKGRVKLIKRLMKLGADLYDPESVKKVIAKQSWSNGRKDLACDAYATFLAMVGGVWERPTYQIIDKEPFIPQPSEVKQLIAGCSPRMACFLQGLLETAMRPGEFWRFPWKDYDQPTRTIRITPEKGSKSGTYKITKELATMLEALPRNYGDRVFSTPDMDLDHWRGNFCRQRKRITQKLQNPRLLQISFKTLRHFKATMVAWQTNSPWIVNDYLRHKNSKNTDRYIHLAQVLFRDQHEYITSVAHNIREACRLIEQGYKYQTGEYDDGGKIFAKPKDPLAYEQ